MKLLSVAMIMAMSMLTGQSQPTAAENTRLRKPGVARNGKTQRGTMPPRNQGKNR